MTLVAKTGDRRYEGRARFTEYAPCALLHALCKRSLPRHGRKFARSGSTMCVGTVHEALGLTCRLLCIDVQEDLLTAAQHLTQTPSRESKITK